MQRKWKEHEVKWKERHWQNERNMNRFAMCFFEVFCLDILWPNSGSNQ